MPVHAVTARAAITEAMDGFPCPSRRARGLMTEDRLLAGQVFNGISVASILLLAALGTGSEFRPDAASSTWRMVRC